MFWKWGKRAATDQQKKQKEQQGASFTTFKLHSTVAAGIRDAGFVRCTPVQERVLHHSLNGSDLMVQSQTGTGKTAAFLITIFHRLLTEKDMNERNALIIAPTRELVIQIEQEALVLGRHISYEVAAIIGGVSYKPQRERLERGARIIVGTPGRLLDLARDATLQLKQIGIVVIDEADRMFDMGFYPEIQRLMRLLPPLRQRMTMLYSATLSTQARNIAWRYMNNPVEIEVTAEKVTVDEVDQKLCHLARSEKFPFLLGYLMRHQPTSALIFTNTKRAAEMVSDQLNATGLSTRYIIGDLPQKKRLRIIEELKTGSLRFLVATDVAARGLHIDNLQLVVNYDLPEDSESYVHRVGRTARAGRAGQAISLACEQFVYGLEAIERFIDMKIPTMQVDEDSLELGRRAIAEAKQSGRLSRAPSRGAAHHTTRSPTHGDRRRGRSSRGNSRGSSGSGSGRNRISTNRGATNRGGSNRSGSNRAGRNHNNRGRNGA